ncbi:MAG: hypothetical protein N2439_04855, partial [Anaerolineae bacterium]|nr:hypothetical protein [Anaerolineae bacterium]
AVPRRDATAPAPFEMAEADQNLPDLHTGLAELRDLAAQEADAATRRLWSRRIIGLLDLLVVLIVLPNRWAIATYRREEGIAAAYARLMSWGGRLGRPVAPGDTPRTYAADIIAAAERIAADLPRPRPRLVQAAAIVRAEVPPLAATFETTLYAGETTCAEKQPPEPARHAALWAALRRLWLARWRI